MLAMKTKCELCRTPIAPDGEAWICSYECTYCRACVATLEECPNCAGELLPRPRRTAGITTVARRAPQRVSRVIARHRQ